MRAPPLPFCAIPWTADLARPLEAASAAIARLDARICVSSAPKPWYLRAAWTGYARALQLQGVEIDEIDIFCWGCGIRVPGRTPRSTVADEFAGFSSWQRSLTRTEGRHWREDLPFSFVVPEQWSQAPRLVQAMEVVDQFARNRPGLDPWLAAPALLHRLGLTTALLPCLVTGDRASRMMGPNRAAVLKRMLKALAEAADQGLKRLLAIESDMARAAAAIAAEHRPGALTSLASLAIARPLLTPQLVASRLRLTLSGAGKLLARASRLGFLVEVSGRASWRTYLAPDLAATFGFMAPPRGRPRSIPSSLSERSLPYMFTALDAELQELEKRWPSIPAEATDADVAADGRL